MKHVIILLLFLIMPKSSFAQMTFTRFGYPDILYKGTFQELINYHEEIADAVETATENKDVELIASLCDLDCMVLTAAGQYKQAREMGQLSVQMYEALLAVSPEEFNSQLLVDYTSAICNLTEVCDLLYIDKDEMLELIKKGYNVTQIWVNWLKDNDQMDRETTINYFYNFVLFYKISAATSFKTRDYLAGMKALEDEIQELETLFEALDMKPHQSIEYIMALQTYANLYDQAEDYEQALHYWTESQKIIEEVYGKQSRLYANTLKGMGWIYYSLNDLQKAYQCFIQSFETYQGGGFSASAEVADLLTLGGMALLNNGLYNESTDAFKKGNEIFKVTCGEKSFPTCLNKILSIYPLWFTKQKTKAKNIMRETLHERSFYMNVRGAHMLNAIAFAMEMERTDKNYKEVYAAEKAVEPLLTYERTKSALKQYYISLGRTYQSDNKMMEACSYFNQALSLQREITRQNFAFLSEMQRADFWRLDQTRFASILRQNQSHQEGNNEIGSLLYDAALLQKSMLLEASVNLARVVEEKGTPELKQKMRHLQMMMQSDLTDEQKLECQALEKEVQNEARKYGDFLTYTNVVWTDVQKALDDQSVAVEFICSETEDGKTHYSAEVLRKGMEKPYHLYLFTVEKDELTRGAGKGAFNDFALKNIWPERLLKLFHPGDNVYFAPSGALHMLPVEYMKMGNGQRMDETYRMHRLSSTREVVRNLNPNLNDNPNLNPNDNGQKTIALFGGFNFNASEDDMELAMISASDDATDATRGKNKASGTAYWSNLPGTLNEVKSIAPIMKNARYKVALHTQDGGTESLFKETSGQHTDIIHVATHGYYLDGKGTQLNQSGLIFSGGNNHWANHKKNPMAPQMDDGILTAEEIAHLNLIGTHLTVLSACQTGLGEVTGEGVFGLQRSFKKAGVQSLLMSLWEVDDEATQLLMTAFYTNYAQGKTKQEALQAAQAELRHHQFMRDGKERSGEDPYFWAGFILIDAKD